MEEVKKKRGRPRKIPTVIDDVKPKKKPKIPKEIQDMINKAHGVVEDPLKEAIEAMKVIPVEEIVEPPKPELQIKETDTDEAIIGKLRDSNEWDVKIGDHIEYFDANLSYELTGYKPINKYRGLDFDPSWFTETRDAFIRTGHYTQFRRNSRSWRAFWKEQFIRCKYGMTSHGYTITGDHYFFLNFYRLKDLDNVEEAGFGRKEIFPNFLEGQYEWFHYLKLARKLRMNACMMKARGAGYSEIEASIISNSYNVIKGSINVCTAFAQTQLDKLLEKVWANINWLYYNTDGGMAHLSQAKNSNYLRRASHYEMRDGQKIEVGWGSQIQGIITDKPGKLRGDRTDILMFEECFGKGTKVIMSDYTIKNIEDIQVGDFVLGLDGSPQEVMHTTQGIDDLYQIHQKRGIDYIVNSKHKLYLEARPRTGGVPDKIVLETAPEYLELSNYKKRTTYGKSNQAINNKKDLCDLDPYYLGLWLGNGWAESPNRVIVNTVKDIEIYNYVIDYFKSINLNPTISECSNTKQCVRILGSTKEYTNILRQSYSKYSLINNKHIPKEVFYSTLDYKLKVLAGLIDTDGSLNKNLRYDISQSRPELASQIAMLARSCGFEVQESIKVPKSGYGKGKTQYILNIKGNINTIPAKIKRKISTIERFNTTNSTGIEIKKLSIGEYYGITLKSYNSPTDNLFLLEDFTIVHNCGLWPQFTKAYTQADALVGQIGRQWGLRLMGGTGGETGAQMEGLRKMYYEPQLFGVLPYRHNFTKSNEYAITSFFLPAFRTIKETSLLDKRGWIDDNAGREYFNKTRDLKAKDPEEYQTYCAEYCFDGEEAFSLEGDNKFNKILIADQIAAIRLHKDCPKPEYGSLEYIFTNGQHTKENISGIRWIPSNFGDVQIIEHPLWTKSYIDDDGNEVSYEKINNLYVAGIDSIDLGGDDTSALTKDPSSFCIVIKRRQFGLKDPQYVAMYKARPNDIRDAYKTAIKLLQYYNCKANLEATRVSILSWAREKKYMNYFMYRPIATYPAGNNPKRRTIGTPASVAIIDHQTDLIRDYVNDYCHNIWFPDMLDELSRYTDEMKRKFDIIAAMGLCELGDEDMMGITPKQTEVSDDSFQDFGYYIDPDTGYRKFGVIPKKITAKATIENTSYVNLGIRTSDPRFN